MGSFVHTVEVVNDTTKIAIKLDADYATILIDDVQQTSSLIVRTAQARLPESQKTIYAKINQKIDDCCFCTFTHFHFQLIYCSSISFLFCVA